MDTIKSIYTPLMKENSMKHIDYKTFNSIQTVANAEVESRYSALQKRVAGLVSDGKNIFKHFFHLNFVLSCQMMISSQSSRPISFYSLMIFAI